MKIVVLPAWPGPSRGFNMTVAQHNGTSDCIYVFSGRRENSRGEIEFLKDIYEFNPSIFLASDSVSAWRKRQDAPACRMAVRHKPYVTCWVALDDMSAANGTISIFPFGRSPLRGLMEHPWEASVNGMVGYDGDDEGDLVEVPAGTLVAFSSFLLHKSGPNTTERPRRSYFIAYTPELFAHADPAKGVYNSGEPLLQDGKLTTSPGKE